MYKKIDLDSLLKKTHKCYVTNCSGNYNAESKLKTLRLPQNRGKEAGGQFLFPGSTFVTLKALLFVKKEIKDFLKDFHFLKDNLQPWIMERYIPVTHPHHLISLNPTYFPTVLSSPRKTFRGPSEIKNIIPD